MAKKWAKNRKQYIYGTCTRRMDLIQSALEKAMSQVSNALFPNIFGSFLTSVGYCKHMRYCLFGLKRQNILPVSGYENQKNPKNSLSKA